MKKPGNEVNRNSINCLDDKIKAELNKVLKSPNLNLPFKVKIPQYSIIRSIHRENAKIYKPRTVANNNIKKIRAASKSNIDSKTTAASHHNITNDKPSRSSCISARSKRQNDKVSQATGLLLKGIKCINSSSSVSNTERLVEKAVKKDINLDYFGFHNKNIKSSCCVYLKEPLKSLSSRASNTSESKGRKYIEKRLMNKGIQTDDLSRAASVSKEVVYRLDLLKTRTESILNTYSNIISKINTHS